MPINKFIPEIWEDFNVEMNDEYTIIWPMRWYPKDEPKKKETKKKKTKIINRIRIFAWLIEIWLIADMIIWLLATANWQRIAWINLFVLSCCCVVLNHIDLE